jgi:predicted secreted protein
MNPPTPHPRKAEADALMTTVEELEEIDRDRSDVREAKMRGIEVWELRMRREGASELTIHTKRKELRRQVADALMMTVDELEEIDRDRSDDREAKILGIEVWELRMRREGASASAIEAKRTEQRRQREEAVGL